MVIELLADMIVKYQRYDGEDFIDAELPLCKGEYEMEMTGEYDGDTVFDTECGGVVFIPRELWTISVSSCA